jgi:hypothetical protein
VFRDPVWRSEVNGTGLAIMFNNVPENRSYDLWVADGVLWRLAGRYGVHYFDARAAAEVWAAYLRDGGTVEAWLRQGRQVLGQSEQVSELLKRFGKGYDVSQPRDLA